MTFSTSLARALVPAALIVAAPAAAAENADLAKVRAHITSVDTMTANFVQTDAKNRAAAEGFTRSDPYDVNGVWETVQIHGYNKKRGTPITSRRG